MKGVWERRCRFIGFLYLHERGVLGQVSGEGTHVAL